MFLRCPLGEAQIAPRLSDGTGGYSRAELMETARSRDADLMRRVLSAITQAGSAAE